MADSSLILPPERKSVARQIAEEPQSLLAVIARASSDPSVDIEKMDKLLQMQERLELKAAEKAFNSAMTDAQIEMGRVKANQKNDQTKSKYADYAQLDKALRPIYTKHGFALSFDTSTATEGMVHVLAHVSHREGFTRDYHADMPADGKGAKGNDVMTKTHATGAAMTYGMRYLLKMIFNVAIGEDDTDGNMPTDKITQDQADELKKMIDDLAFEVDGKDADYAAWLQVFLDHMKVAAIEEISAKSFVRAKDSIAATRKARLGK